MTLAVEIVLVEGIDEAFSVSLAKSNLIGEVSRLHKEEKSFEFSRVDDHVVKYRNVKPPLDEKAITATYAYVMNNKAEVIAYYRFNHIKHLMR